MPEETTDNQKQKLTQLIQFIKGVGPERAQILEKLNLRTAADLLFFFPRSYEDFTQLHKIVELENEQLANLLGTVFDVNVRMSSNGRQILTVTLQQEDQYFKAIWFGQTYMSKRFSVGQRVLVRGKAKLHAGRFQVNHPKVTWVDDCLLYTSPSPRDS